MRFLDLDAWPRKQHFELFRRYEQPFFNVTAPVDVTELWHWCLGDGERSFALAYHWVTLQVVNQIECFRYRIRGDRVLVHEVIDLGMTVLRDDETFAFCYVDFNSDFTAFQNEARLVIRNAKANTGS